MISDASMQHRLSYRFERAQDGINKAALGGDGSFSDMLAFNSALQQMQGASYAAQQQLEVKHSVAKSIIDNMP